MGLILLENFDNTDTFRYLDADGTNTLMEGDGKAGSNACQLLISNKIQIEPSTKVILGFYVKDFTSEYISFGNPAGGESFRVNIAKTTTGVLTFSFYNPQQEDIENYPEITNHTGYQDTDTGYSLIEIELDLINATAFEGILKVAIDGITYVDLADVVNAPINLWTDGLSSETASYSTIAFSNWIVDSLYVCNESKGYNDSFFGPYDITTLLPMMDGDQVNWERRLYSESVDDDNVGDHWPYVVKDPFELGTADAQNVIASQTLIKDLFFFDPDGLPNQDVEVKAVQQSIWMKGLFEQDDQEELSIITPIAKASGRDITNSSDYDDFTSPFYFKHLLTPYDVVPTVSTAWTQETLGLTQFGYCFYETFESDVISDATITADNLTVGDLTYLTDDDVTTYIKADEVTFTFATAINVKKLNFISQVYEPWGISSITSIELYDFDGAEYSMNAPVTDYDEGTVVVTNNEDYLLIDILQVKITLREAYKLYSANIIKWEKVS